MLTKIQEKKLGNLIIFFVQNTRYCGVTKLNKLLYAADFIHFRQTGRSITGNRYFAFQRGPVARPFLDDYKAKSKYLLKYVTWKTTDRQTIFTPVKKFSSKHLTERELEIITAIAKKYKHVFTIDICELSHSVGDPWEVTIKEKGSMQEIDYLLSAGKSKDSLSIEELKERIAESQLLRQIMNE